jgi:hypothetical protein
MLTFEFAKAYFEGGLCLVSSGEDYVLAGTQIRIKAPGELLTKTGARMMAITLPDPNLGAFLTIPAASGRFLEMFRSELHNKLTLGDDRALGSCLHRFQSLVELNARFTSDFNSCPIPDAERKWGSVNRKCVNGVRLDLTVRLLSVYGLKGAHSPPWPAYPASSQTV